MRWFNYNNQTKKLKAILSFLKSGDLRHSKLKVRRFTFCAYMDHTRFFLFRGCARSILPISHTNAESEVLSLDAVYVWMDHQLFNSGSVAWKRFPVSQPTETLSVANAKDSFRVILILTIVCLRQLATFRPTAHTQPIPFEDNAGVVQMVNKGRSPNLRHVTRTHIVDLDWLLERE